MLRSIFRGIRMEGCGLNSPDSGPVIATSTKQITRLLYCLILVSLIFILTDIKCLHVHFNLLQYFFPSHNSYLSSHRIKIYIYIYKRL
jgi:hypothetical protein